MKNLPAVVFVLCSSHKRVTRAQEYTVISSETGIVPTSAPAEVSCEFTNQWTSERHPRAYPPAARARWSPMILASHSSDYTMWADGELASPAIQALAEVSLLLIPCTNLTAYLVIKYSFAIAWSDKIDVPPLTSLQTGNQLPLLEELEDSATVAGQTKRDRHASHCNSNRRLLTR